MSDAQPAGDGVCLQCLRFRTRHATFDGSGSGCSWWAWRVIFLKKLVQA